MKERFRDSWFIPGILLLFLYFLYRLWNQAQLLRIFPLDATNDWASHIAKIYFFDVCGYYQQCAYWYNGFTLFELYPPAYFFYTWILQRITDNYLVTAYISMIILFVIGFLLLWKFGKQENLSRTKRIAFFAFYSLNAIAIGNYIRVGRMPELFAWIIFIGFATSMLYFRNKPLNKYFFVTIFSYAILLISHQTTAILATILWLSLFLVQSSKLKVIGGFILSVALTSWWTIPYVIASQHTQTYSYVLSQWLLDFKVLLLENLAITAICIATLIAFYAYWKTQEHNNKELLFFSPIIALTLLVLFRLVPFLPILQYVYSDPYANFILFFGLFFFLASSPKAYPKLLVPILIIGILLLPIASIAINHYKTNQYGKDTYFQEHDAIAKDTIAIIPSVEERYEILGGLASDDTFYDKAFYAYAAIYHNKRSAGGWNEQFISSDYNRLLVSLDLDLRQKNCLSLTKKLVRLNVTDAITYGEHCNTLALCGWQEKIRKGQACMFEHLE